MVDRPAACITALLLVVSAGCGGLPAEETGAFQTPASGATGQASAPSEPPRNISDVLEAHRETLRSEGSFTVLKHQTVRITEPDRNVTARTRMIRRFDLESGRTAITHNQSIGSDGTSTFTWVNDSKTSFRATDGTVYGRQVSFGRVSYTRGDDNLPPSVRSPRNVTTASTPDVLDDTSSVHFTYEGRGAVAGTEGYVFTARGPEAATGELRTGNFSVEAFTLVVLTTPTGRIKVTDLSMEIVQDGTHAAISETTEFTAVGSTTVRPPSWLDDAKADLAEPGPNDIVTRTFRVAAPDGLVEQHVTARKHSLEAGDPIGPVVSENGVYRNDFLNRSRVGGIVRAYWLGAEDVERVRLVFHYEDAAVPGRESSLTVVYDDRESALLQPIESTVDPDANTVTVEITDRTRLDRLQGRTMFVLDREAYLTALNEQ